MSKTIAISCFKLVGGLFFCLLTDTAQAQTPASVIYKCADGGSHRYQNQPCEHRQRTLAKIEYVTRAIDPALSAQTKLTEQDMDRRYAQPMRQTVSRTASARRKSNATPCETAKSKRDRELKRVGLKRNFDLLSRLDGEVWEACKGF